MKIFEQTIDPMRLTITGTNPTDSFRKISIYIIFILGLILLDYWNNFNNFSSIMFGVFVLLVNIIAEIYQYWQMKYKQYTYIHSIEIVYKPKKEKILSLKINGQKLRVPYRKTVEEIEKFTIGGFLGGVAKIYIHEVNIISLNGYELDFQIEIDTDRFFQPVPNKMEIHMID